MEVYFEYLLKSIGVLSLFLVIYHVFLRKETNFQHNRWFLVMGLAISLIAPFLTITKTVLVEAGQAKVSQGLSGHTVTLLTETETSFNLLEVLLPIYLMGVLFFGIRLLLQLVKINRIKGESNIIAQRPFYHVETPRSIAPFSFFNYIFYHPRQFEENELNTIIAHERVHARERHSIDILFAELVFIIQWFNPLAWYYRLTMKQNLEFLADAQTCNEIDNRKFYQYLMLKQATGTHTIAIANPFFNHLTKKRIVMMNKQKSKKINSLKLLLVLPLLAIFLISFNTKTIYETTGVANTSNWQEGKTIELVIDKGTTDEELEKMKKKLAEDGVDLSYRTVRNGQKEIIALKIHLQGSSESGRTFNANFDVESEEPINPVLVSCDLEEGTASVGNFNPHKDKGHTMIRISDKDEKIKEVEVIKSKDGTKKVLINGKEATEDELHEIEVDVEDGTQIHWESDEDVDKKNIKVIRQKGGSGQNVHIIRKIDDDEDIEVIGDDGFFFIDHDGKGKPLYYIDGKKASEKEVKALSPNTVKTINVSKGDAAIEKYGKKAKDGVVEITTKKKN